MRQIRPPSGRQLAVQEFRVLSSNWKAEFEDAGTAIITAVTRSGTNEFRGEAGTGN